MKTIFCIAIIAACIACNNSTEEKNSHKDKSITTANAYNAVFLDSVSLSQFVRGISDANTAKGVQDFYNNRNNEYAWFDNNGLTEEARGFWNLFSTVNDTAARNKKLVQQMKEFIADDDFSVSSSNKQVAGIEMMLTQALITFMQQQGVSVKNKELAHFIPVKKAPLKTIAASFADEKDGAYDNSNEAFSKLKGFLKQYNNIAGKGGWPTNIPYTKTTLKPHTSHAAIALIKRRLQATQEFKGNDTSALFDDALVNAVKTYQASLGYTPTGFITDSLIKEMNVSVQSRLQQIIINLNRMRWVPGEVKGRMILVNIPEFKLYAYDNAQKTLDMNVVVGKQGHSTVIFTGKLNEIVFSPYWNVPRSIVRNEIQPAMKDNPHYLEQQHMEVTGESNGLPVVRQLPGEKNSLGKVKFLFPNDFDIYFHDTPSKDLFNKDKRAYSHGCIRLSDPPAMAAYLLQDDKSWTKEKIAEAMNSGKEKSVQVKKPVPVIITYYTAWVDGNGVLNFRNDIYQHDAEIAAKMFTD